VQGRKCFILVKAAVLLHEEEPKAATGSEAVLLPKKGQANLLQLR
jgi:hypothetical protein